MEVGISLTAIDGVVRVTSLDLTFIGEQVLLTIIRALTLNLELLISGLVALGNDRNTIEGDITERLFIEVIISVGFSMIGRIIDPVANFIDE